MASELRVNTLKDAAGANSVAMEYVAGGSAKAWGHVATANSTTLDDSFNYTSVTDNGTGDWTYAFTNSMTNSAYSFVSIHGSAGSNSAFSRSNTYATGSIRFWTYTGAGVTDAVLITNTVNGDLA